MNHGDSHGLCRLSKNPLTRAVHAGSPVDAETGAIIPPIYQTSTYVQSEPGVHKGYDYTRAGNPTRSLYEEALAILEGADYGHAFSSGLAAEQAIIQLVGVRGGHILVSDDVYGGTGRLFRNLYAKYGLVFDFIDMRDLKSLEKAITPKTEMVWVETPSNPTMKIIDLEAVHTICQKASQKPYLVVDNTFASPIFQSPLTLGADIVVHSTTKYIGGHSDLIGGAVMTSDEEVHEKIAFIQMAAGAVPSPFDCFLLHRSIKTLAVRMQQHHINSMAVAEFLQSQPQVSEVLYPGLASHPDHQLAKKQMSGYSGIVSIRVKGGYDQVRKFLKPLTVFKLAESLGGIESLVNHPERMTHASVPPDLRERLGIGPDLLRLSVGIEDPRDLIGDLQQALKTL